MLTKITNYQQTEQWKGKRHFQQVKNLLKTPL